MARGFDRKAREERNMLKYLITATETLIAAAVLLGMLSAYIPAVYGERGRNILTAGSLAGLLAAVVMSYLKNMTKLINTSTWNLRIFTVAILGFLAFLVLDLNWFRKRKAAGAAVPGLAALLSFTIILYALPDVLAYPYNFVLGGDAVFSTGFLYRFIGLALGVGLCVLAGLAVRQVCRRVRPGALGLLLKLALGVNALQQLSKILSILLARRVLNGQALFRVARFTSNNAKLFLYAVLVLASLVPLALWAKSLHVREPYENPAQRRKIRAKWMSVRRWSATVLASFAASVLILTAVNAYANRPVTLSAIEECELRGTELFIPFEQVDDGHLHRFAYTTDNHIAVRFIIIKKPNSSAYGVGLDACDICGETGYYERGGQVVCNRCDVVMNINTIGFKGGCNPKVIDYSIENGYIIVPVSALIEHESDFK